MESVTREDSQWDLAKKKDSSAGYSQYINGFRLGKHDGEARERLTKAMLREAIITEFGSFSLTLQTSGFDMNTGSMPSTMHLRFVSTSGPREAILTKGTITDTETKEKGAETIGGAPVIVDTKYSVTYFDLRRYHASFITNEIYGGVKFLDSCVDSIMDYCWPEQPRTDVIQNEKKRLRRTLLYVLLDKNDKENIPIIIKSMNLAK